MFSYWAKAQDAADLAATLNDHVAGVVRDWPGRFVGLGTLPMQDARLAVRELVRPSRVRTGDHVECDHRVIPSR